MVVGDVSVRTCRDSYLERIKGTCGCGKGRTNLNPPRAGEEF